MVWSPAASPAATQRLSQARPVDRHGRPDDVELLEDDDFLELFGSRIDPDAPRSPGALSSSPYCAATEPVDGSASKRPPCSPCAASPLKEQEEKRPKRVTKPTSKILSQISRVLVAAAAAEAKANKVDAVKKRNEPRPARVYSPHRFLAKFFLLTLSPHDLRLLPRVPLLLLRIAYFSLLVLKVLRLTRLRKNCRRDCLRALYASFMPGHARPFAPPMRLPVVTCFPAGSACCTCRPSPCSRRPTSCSAASRSFCAQCSACCTCRSSPCSRRPTSCGAASRSSSSRSGGSSVPAP
ncbi:hypothetical protein M885DRAFT_86213 [Pelagophyceae sp. CCMP2097]|nr:hypothetical protein M885DRAFT_86213 [Pelagophyceae sp. CCMP2097]